MAYDPDKNRFLDILQVSKTFQEDDRQDPYDKIYDALVKAGFGVTRVGDRLTVRSCTWQASFVLLEVELQRDVYQPDEK